MTATTLAEHLEGAFSNYEDVEREHRPILKLVKELIGVIPNCDPVLDIWPTGFRTYNLLVPNLLNLPGSLIGQGAPKDLVGLAMYLSSRAAECMYCSAHTCSYALRRGTTPEAILGNFSDREAAVAAVADGLGRVPASLVKGHITDVRKHLNETEIEWVVLSVCLMGFLNKFMDTMGIELEAESIDDVSDLISETGWTPGQHVWSVEDVDNGADGQAEGRPLVRKSISNRNGDGHTPGDGDAGGPIGATGYANVPTDSASTYLRVLRRAPGAMRKERAWTKGVSGRIGPALMMLEDHLGYAYGTLASLNQNRAVRAIATVLRDNLDEQNTSIGLSAKCLIALVYARVVGNDVLTAEAIQIAERVAPQLDQRVLASVGRFATADATSASIPPGLSSAEAAAVILAKAAAPSPSEVNQITVASTMDALDPDQIVEAVVWISVQQLLHRLYVFYDVDNGHSGN